MHLPVQPPIDPMLAKAVPGIPDPADVPAGLAFEPKWDGFRCLVFRDRDEIELYSRGRGRGPDRGPRPLGRYFPELLETLRDQLPARVVLDGEIVVAVAGRLDFPRLQERLHPAGSRVRMLAERQPASFIAFDLLAIDDRDLTDEPFAARRSTLEQTLVQAVAPVFLTPITRDPELARRWFDLVEGAGLDGLVAKPLDLRYRPGVRAMLKIKHARTADVVVAGYRLHKSSTEDRPLLGSLLLGLFDETGVLQHVGVAAAFPTKRRAELHAELQPLVLALDAHPWGRWIADEPPSRRPDMVSRWNTGKDLSFVPLDPVLVCEVGYDAMEGPRFRHTAQFKRWRPDRDPESCTYDQLERPITVPLHQVLAGTVGADNDG